MMPLLSTYVDRMRPLSAMSYIFIIFTVATPTLQSLMTRPIEVRLYDALMYSGLYSLVLVGMWRLVGLDILVGTCVLVCNHVVRMCSAIQTLDCAKRVIDSSSRASHGHAIVVVFIN